MDAGGFPLRPPWPAQGSRMQPSQQPEAMSGVPGGGAPWQQGMRGLQGESAPGPSPGPGPGLGGGAGAGSPSMPQQSLAAQASVLQALQRNVLLGGQVSHLGGPGGNMAAVLLAHGQAQQQAAMAGGLPPFQQAMLQQMHLQQRQQQQQLEHQKAAQVPLEELRVLEAAQRELTERNMQPQPQQQQQQAAAGLDRDRWRAGGPGGAAVWRGQPANGHYSQPGPNQGLPLQQLPHGMLPLAQLTALAAAGASPEKRKREEAMLRLPEAKKAHMAWPAPALPAAAPGAASMPGAASPGTVVIQGLAAQTGEGAVVAALERRGFGQVLRSVRVACDAVGVSQGVAFADFLPADAAQAVVDSCQTAGSLVVDGQFVAVQLRYQPVLLPGPPVLGALGGGGQVAAAAVSPGGWMCLACGASNVPLQRECFKCKSPPPSLLGNRVATSGAQNGHPAALPVGPQAPLAPQPNARHQLLHVAGGSTPSPSKAPFAQQPRPTAQAIPPSEPTHVLMVRGLDESSMEENLHYEFSKHAPIKELRFLRDKVTNRPRGFAFVHFYSVEDATKALEATSGTLRLEKGGHLLRVMYARNPNGPPPTPGLMGPGPGPVPVLRAVSDLSSQYESVGWAPKEYDPNGIVVQEDPAAAAAASAAAASAGEGGEQAATTLSGGLEEGLAQPPVPTEEGQPPLGTRHEADAAVQADSDANARSSPFAEGAGPAEGARTPPEAGVDAGAEAGADADTETCADAGAGAGTKADAGADADAIESTSRPPSSQAPSSSQSPSPRPLAIPPPPPPRTSAPAPPAPAPASVPAPAPTSSASASPQIASEVEVPGVGDHWDSSATPMDSEEVPPNAEVEKAGNQPELEVAGGEGVAALDEVPAVAAGPSPEPAPAVAAAKVALVAEAPPAAAAAAAAGVPADEAATAADAAALEESEATVAEAKATALAVAGPAMTLAGEGGSGGGASESDSPSTVAEGKPLVSYEADKDADDEAAPLGSPTAAPTTVPTPAPAPALATTRHKHAGSTSGGRPKSLLDAYAMAHQAKAEQAPGFVRPKERAPPAAQLAALEALQGSPGAGLLARAPPTSVGSARPQPPPLAPLPAPRAVARARPVQASASGYQGTASAGYGLLPAPVGAPPAPALAPMPAPSPSPIAAPTAAPQAASYYYDAASAAAGGQQAQQDPGLSAAAAGGGVQAGFVWDEASGYYYDPASQLYYDGNSGLFYDSVTSSWLAYDESTQQYVQYGIADNSAAAATAAAAPAPAPAPAQTAGSQPLLAYGSGQLPAAAGSQESSLHGTYGQPQPTAAAAAYGGVQQDPGLGGAPQQQQQQQHYDPSRQAYNVPQPLPGDVAYQVAAAAQAQQQQQQPQPQPQHQYSNQAGTEYFYAGGSGSGSVPTGAIPRQAQAQTQMQMLHPSYDPPAAAGGGGGGGAHVGGPQGQGQGQGQAQGDGGGGIGGHFAQSRLHTPQAQIALFGSMGGAQGQGHLAAPGQGPRQVNQLIAAHGADPRVHSGPDENRHLSLADLVAVAAAEKAEAKAAGPHHHHRQQQPQDSEHERKRGGRGARFESAPPPEEAHMWSRARNGPRDGPQLRDVRDGPPRGAREGGGALGPGAGTGRSGAGAGAGAAGGPFSGPHAGTGPAGLFPIMGGGAAYMGVGFVPAGEAATANYGGGSGGFGGQGGVMARGGGSAAFGGLPAGMAPGAEAAMQRHGRRPEEFRALQGDGAGGPLGGLRGPHGGPMVALRGGFQEGPAGMHPADQARESQARGGNPWLADQRGSIMPGSQVGMAPGRQEGGGGGMPFMGARKPQPHGPNQAGAPLQDAFMGSKPRGDHRTFGNHVPRRRGWQ